VHALEDVYLAEEPVGEGQAQRPVANHGHVGDIWGATGSRASERHP
jgi:hypothetical protein